MTDQIPEARLAAAVLHVIDAACDWFVDGPHEESQKAARLNNRVSELRLLDPDGSRTDALAADPTLICPDPAAHDLLAEAVEVLRTAPLVLDQTDQTAAWETRRHCIIKAAKEAERR